MQPHFIEVIQNRRLKTSSHNPARKLARPNEDSSSFPPPTDLSGEVMDIAPWVDENDDDSPGSDDLLESGGSSTTSSDSELNDPIEPEPASSTNRVERDAGHTQSHLDRTGTIVGPIADTTHKKCGQQDDAGPTSDSACNKCG